jgi:hypothetical protein
LAVVELHYQGQIYHLVEVDTSDAKNAISTMLMKLKDTSNLFDQITELEIRLLKKSLAWPRDYIEMICGEGNFDGSSHPPSKHKGLIDPADWAGLLVNKSDRKSN